MHRLIAVAAAVVLSNAIAQPASNLQSEAADAELGWRFSECFYYYTFMSEGMKSIEDAQAEETFKKMRNLSISAALTLIGEDKYKAEVQGMNAEIIQKLRSMPPKAELDRINDACLSLSQTHIDRLAPRIIEFAKNRASKKEK